MTVGLVGLAVCVAVLCAIVMRFVRVERKDNQ